MFKNVADIEKAVFITDPEHFKETYDLTHLYVGDEFCERRLPSLILLKQIFFRFPHSDKKVTIVTPYLTNKGMEQLLHILNWVSLKNLQCEIVINDWPVLRAIKKYSKNFELIAGRLLVSRYFYKFKYPYYLFPDSFLNFLGKYKIFRLEFNSFNHLKLTQQQLLERGFKSHIYFPFMYLTTSRYCTCPCGYDSYLREATVSCNKECESSFAIMKNKNFTSGIFIKGNTYFIKNTEKEDIVGAIVDRIIYNNFTEDISKIQYQRCIE